MSATHLYRQSKIGDSLVEALDALVDSGKLPGNLALRIMQEFDKAIITALEEDVTAKSTFKGQLDVYRYCDNVWTFVISGAEFKLFPTLGGTKRDGEELNVDKIKMVLVDSKIASA